MAQQFTPEQMEKLLQYAGDRLNTSPEDLKKAFEKDGLYGVSRQAGERLSPELLEQVNALMADKEKAARLMESPAVQQLLHRLSENR